MLIYFVYCVRKESTFSWVQWFMPVIPKGGDQKDRGSGQPRQKLSETPVPISTSKLGMVVWTCYASHMRHR
jgi:hypothetical protein